MRKRLANGRSSALTVLSCLTIFCCVVMAASIPAWAADDAKPAADAGGKFRYQKAPKLIEQVLDAPAMPTVIVSPTRDRLLVVDSRRHPPVADLAQPMLRIAGLRINPATNGPHHPPRHIALSVVTIDGGKTAKVVLPANAWVSVPEWAADGKHFAFLNYTATGIELYVGDAQTAAAHKVAGVAVNAAYREAINWMPDSRTLLVLTVPAGRGKAPVEAAVPAGPHVQESAGKVAPIPTYEDLLQNTHDEDLFDYYCTSQLNLVDAQTGKATAVGKPAIFDQIDASPDGQHLLVARLHKPYSYLIPAPEFPKLVEVWDRGGKVEYKVADLPSHEGVPLEGVLTGPRNYSWRATAPATLVWAEALDGGNTRAKVPFHDRVMALAAPFKSEPAELVKLQFRLMSRGAGVGGRGGAPPVMWGEKFALVSQYDRARRWLQTLMIDPDRPGAAPAGDAGVSARVIWDRSAQDRYNDPGIPVMRVTQNGQRVIQQSGETIFLRSEGASAKGDFPFLAKFDLETRKTEKIFQAADQTYEAVETVLSNDGSKFLTRFETPTDVPNYFVRTAGSSEKVAVTHFADPTPQLRGIQKQLVTYKRDDGVPLSFTLYLPPDCGSAEDKGAMPCHQAGVPMPTIVWAYPLEFSDASTAGQVSGSQYRFTTMGGISELFLVTQGYAVLDNATMPVIGDPDTMNNTYVEQITASAKAAIDKAAQMGVTDANRVGVGGHSYGAFMTANLLAHCNLFKAGVARSGAYNRTLTPFGFQSERRTFWEAPDMYLKVSPFAHAQNIKTPILLIHGEADDNSGTFPIQSERMYQAIKGNGGVVRYVTLPYEAHGYLGRETVAHVQWEMLTWFDRWVKNAKQQPAAVAAQ